MTELPFSVFTSSDLPAPEELERAIEMLDEVTLQNLMKVCLLGISLAEKHPDRRRGIAASLRGLFYDYDEMGYDSDLYKMRYCRLVPEIESTLNLLSTYPDNASEPGKTLEQRWTGLKWLIEDQQKIIS